MSCHDAKCLGRLSDGAIGEVLKAGDVASASCGEEYIAPLRRKIAEIGCRLGTTVRSLWPTTSVAAGK
jgi:hypothetical protein